MYQSHKVHNNHRNLAVIRIVQLERLNLRDEGFDLFYSSVIEHVHGLFGARRSIARSVGVDKR